MKKLVYLSILIISIASCKKEETITLAGTYTGTFKTIYANTTTIVDSEILFGANTYKVKKGSLGGGVFSIDSKTKDVLFTNQLATIAQAGIYVLNGNYSYEAKGDSVILTSILPSGAIETFAPTTYQQYRLKHSN